jgi:hypothetical protein
VLDADYDPHYIPAHQIRDIQNWDKEWGKGTTAITLSNNNASRAMFYIYKELEEVVCLYKQAMAGQDFNLKDCSGPILGEDKLDTLQPPEDYPDLILKNYEADEDEQESEDIEYQRQRIRRPLPPFY